MWHRVLLPSPPSYKHSTLGSPSMSPHTPQSIVPKCTSTHRQLALPRSAKSTPQRRAKQRWGTSATAGAASGTWGLCQEIGITLHLPGPGIAEPAQDCLWRGEGAQWLSPHPWSRQAPNRQHSGLELELLVPKLGAQPFSRTQIGDPR